MTLVEQGLNRLISLPFDGRRYTPDGFSEKVLSAGVKKFIREYMKKHGISDQNYFLGANMGQEYEDKAIVTNKPEQSFCGIENHHKSERKPVKTEWQALTIEVTAPFASELILETAKIIVDEARPQFRGPYGGTGYSMIRRQRILDVVLWFFDEHKRFPIGDFGLDSNWVWVDGLGSPGLGRWYVWNGAGKRVKPCFWVNFKAVSNEVLEQCQKEWRYLT